MQMTSLSEFTRLGDKHRIVPVYATVLADNETPLSVYRKITRGNPGEFLLESASNGTWSRYSFVGRNPLATITANANGEVVWLGEVPEGAPTQGDPLSVVEEVLELLQAAPHPSLPPMISSLVGYLGWDIIRRIENLGPSPLREDALPELSMSIPGDVVIVDHYTNELTVVANVVNINGEESGIEAAYQRGVERVERLLADINTPSDPSLSVYTRPTPEVSYRTEPADYMAAIDEAKKRIVDGDIFQVVLGQRFDMDVDATPLDVYRMLRNTNPSQFMYIMNMPGVDGDDFTVIGSSPEALVTVKDSEVVTHPIAGSRPRGTTDAQDAALARELLADEKERAEHLMLVDLARNDLAKVCVPGTVDVVEYMEIERYSTIMHIGSTVTGQLRDGVTGVDVVKATFPAGTLSGAPKPSALRIIDELETVSRNVYGGVVGYMSFAGDLDLAIGIRTGVMRAGTLTVYAGAGIVADSDPESELTESKNKAASVLNAGAAANTLGSVGTRGEGE
ncbi:chorismate-binding protein [Brevibacterium paucivorans]|uniref:Anthranilate synthase component 1 n=1 Tax=Brevibacterium paucivorans TaxID=170994 RepID=A0A2N6VQL6_9MICO|nr:chorismate-binding protein [Brevibacterium paucivorans]PMD06416.1 anthranilate synthase component I [Brevibacterium paucivorans]